MGHEEQKECTSKDERESTNLVTGERHFLLVASWTDKKLINSGEQ